MAGASPTVSPLPHQHTFETEVVIAYKCICNIYYQCVLSMYVQYKQGAHIFIQPTLPDIHVHTYTAKCILQHLNSKTRVSPAKQGAKKRKERKGKEKKRREN
ncbi:hypothetical protein I7I48_04505 [Histoplasma ohiense]|nr:hypothetical protein I7I48_04505 [Histoplasma ohiense (nom. inval.)]